MRVLRGLPSGKHWPVLGVVPPAVPVPSAAGLPHSVMASEGGSEPELPGTRVKEVPSTVIVA